MFPFTFVLLFLILGAICSFIYLQHNPHRKNLQKLPPSPPSLPIIGNLLMLGKLPHRTLQNLAKTYGPIMSLRLGSVPTIVISSPKAAELFLKTHDTAFANRPKTVASEYLIYGSKGMIFTEYGPYWRNIRNLCTQELMNKSKINSYKDMRRVKLEKLVESLKEAAAAHEVVDLTEKVGSLLEDEACMMIFGRSSDDWFDLKTVISEIMVLLGTFNIAEFLPFLGPLDLQGLNRRMKAAKKTIDKILAETIIDEHEQHASWINQTHRKDFVDVMLSLMNKSSSTDERFSYSIDRTNIKAIILEMIMASMDTSSVVIDWLLSELMRHPRVMKKVQEELKSLVREDRMVTENDLSSLKYLEMVIKENFRLHPPPLLLPRESIEDIIIDQHFIPKKSRIIVNTWALGRDQNVWSENAEEFFPERFADDNVDYRGQHFQLLPFGSGRRGCPGMNLGLLNIQLVVAQLLHCFDWELPNGMTPFELDMTEKGFGIAVTRSKHLLAVPTYRLHGKK